MSDRPAHVDIGGDHGPVEVRASGGVVAQPADQASESRLLVVHRPRYDDWSLPKGKLDPGETDEECALREVEEETGLVCELGVELPTVRYLDRKDRSKQVRYWAMAVTSGSFEPNDEVDEIRWLTVPEAAALLTYPHDIGVIEAWARSIRP